MLAAKLSSPALCAAALAALVSVAHCGGSSSGSGVNANTVDGGTSGTTDGGGGTDGGLGGDGGTDGGVAGALFAYPPSGAGGLLPSSRAAGQGSDSDTWAYDSFTLSFDHPVSEVSWRGGYTGGAGAVSGFTITIFPSLAGSTFPQVVNPQLEDSGSPALAKYTVSGNAGETPAGTAGGQAYNDYRYALPTPFQAQAGVTYWLRIEATQSSTPTWGLAPGTGGDGRNYRFNTGTARFAFFSDGDLAFTLR